MKDPFLGASDAAAKLRAIDWSRSSRGEPTGWPHSVRSTVMLILESAIPMFISWGDELTFVYNDAYAQILSEKHPAAMGAQFKNIWSEIWDDIEPLIKRALSGETIRIDNLPLTINRQGFAEETAHTFSYSPLRDDDGEIVGMFCATSETTIQVAAERGLRGIAQNLEAEATERSAAVRLFENIVQSDQSPICAFDTGYRLIAFNAAHSDEFYRIFGHRVQVGEVFPDLFPPAQASVIRGFMERALTGDKFTVIEEFGDPSLAKPYWEVAYAPLRDEAGAIIGAFHHAKDISERLRGQAELESAQEALRQAQKMEAVGQLTGGLAHDFNNLLTGVMGNLELLHARISAGRTEDSERFVTAAQHAGRRAAALTQRLLAFSRRQTLDPKPTDVNRLVAGMEELIRRTIGPGITLEVIGTVGVWTALIDAGQLENALLNLCLNARDAMPNGGRITIETANKWLDERAAKERDMAAGQYLSICVTDTGTGMTPETIARAFDPFFTTKPMGEGTGLGLSMIYGFARQSGGQVRIYSEVGQGTTLCIYLPRHSGDALLDAEFSKKEEIHRDTGATVLVVEDETSIRELIEEVLSDLGYYVITAPDGASGLRILQASNRVDLLVADVGLPNGMNGRQVADAARLIIPSLAVLFITGFAENAAIGNGQLDRGMELLTKPFTLVELGRRIQSILKSSGTRQK